VFREDMFDEAENLELRTSRPSHDSEAISEQGIEDRGRLSARALSSGDSKPAMMGQDRRAYYFFKSDQRMRSESSAVEAGRSA